MKRKAVLPIWIRFFAWLHLLSFVAIPIFVIGLFGEASLTAFGFSYSGSPLQFKAVWITIVCTMAGLTAVGILWGKDWAIDLGIPYGYLAIITCVIGFALSFEAGSFDIPFEPIFLGFFLKSMHDKSAAWHDFNSDDEDISNRQAEPIEKTPSDEPLGQDGQG